MSAQLDLFGQTTVFPAGFRHQPDLLTEAEEHELLAHIRPLPFREFEFLGFLGKRRVVSFGWRYDFAHAKLQQADDIPDFMLALRRKAAEFAGIVPAALVHALVAEYSVGAAIGWHLDRPVFDDVVGVSLLSPCGFRFWRKMGTAWQRASLRLAPRSAYLLRGPARTEWEHSIPAVERLRYSITFRSLRSAPAGRPARTANHRRNAR